MSPPRLTRDEQRARTRADLLEAAVSVFAERGYHGASVDQVADAAGFTKGAVYSNFSSKEELFLALFDEVHEDMLAGLDQAMAVAPEQRGAAIAAAVSTWSRTWFLLETEFELYAARKPGLREVVAKRQAATRARIAAVIGRHMANAGTAGQHDPDDLARLVVAVVDGVNLMALNNDDTDRGRLLSTFLALLTR